VVKSKTKRNYDDEYPVVCKINHVPRGGVRKDKVKFYAFGENKRPSIEGGGKDRCRSGGSGIVRKLVKVIKKGKLIGNPHCW